VTLRLLLTGSRGTTPDQGAGVRVALSVARIVREERPIEVPVFGRMVVVPDFPQDTVNATVRRIVAQGAAITSDGWLALQGCTSRPLRARASPLPTFPPIKTLMSNAKAWNPGTFHGLRYTYKRAYLDECRKQETWRTPSSKPSLDRHRPHGPWLMAPPASSAKAGR
jgi:hypothetical protein